jgi:hypothetical protein
MSKDEVIKTLAEFFMDAFADDPGGVGEWLADSGQDADEFYEAAKSIKNNHQ